MLKAFEDMGFYCVDNLPVELIPIFAELHAAGEGDFARAALLVDAREGLQLEKLPGLLRHLRREHPITLVFIEANEDALLRRYSGRGARILSARIFRCARACIMSAC